MAEQIVINSTATKAEKYEPLIPQIKSLISTETDVIANLANVAAVLKSELKFFWVGFYIVKADELVLGPFQGPLACTRIAKDKGVCGAAWTEQKTQLVEDVDQFPGHIACSSESKSEIVLPIFKNGEVAMVLDIDSRRKADFDAVDQKYLEQLAEVIEERL